MPRCFLELLNPQHSIVWLHNAQRESGLKISFKASDLSFFVLFAKQVFKIGFPNIFSPIPSNIYSALERFLRHLLFLFWILPTTCAAPGPCLVMFGLDGPPHITSETYKLLLHLCNYQGGVLPAIKLVSNTVLHDVEWWPSILSCLALSQSKTLSSTKSPPWSRAAAPGVSFKRFFVRERPPGENPSPAVLV